MSLNISIVVNPPGASITPTPASARPGDTISWSVDRGCAAIRFRGGADPVAFERNVATPGAPAIGRVRQVPSGDYPYDVSGVTVGQDPDASPIEPGVQPFSAAAVLIVERTA